MKNSILWIYRHTQTPLALHVTCALPKPKFLDRTLIDIIPIHIHSSKHDKNWIINVKIFKVQQPSHLIGSYTPIEKFPDIGESMPILNIPTMITMHNYSSGVASSPGLHLFLSILSSCLRVISSRIIIRGGLREAQDEASSGSYIGSNSLDSLSFVLQWLGYCPIVLQCLGYCPIVLQWLVSYCPIVCP